LTDKTQARSEDIQTRKKGWEAEVRKIESQVVQLVDRVMDADAESQTLIKAYESRIQGLESRKAELKERIAKSGRTPKDFDTAFRTAMTFLVNPYRIWVSGIFEHKRLVLKLAFAERLQYLRESGFRTALTASPFTLLCGLSGGGKEMVRLLSSWASRSAAVTDATQRAFQSGSNLGLVTAAS